MKRADKNIVINVNNVGIDNKVEVNVNVMIGDLSRAQVLFCV